MGSVEDSAGPGLSRPVPISAALDFGSFGCGNDVLDAWLRSVALKSEGRSARTYVTCLGQSVAGYYCIATGSVERKELPRVIRQGNPDPVPVLVIGRLAVDARHQGKGIGAALLRDALLRALEIQRVAGCRAVVVHAIDDAAKRFYARYGFIAFPSEGRTMFLPVESLARAL